MIDTKYSPVRCGRCGTHLSSSYRPVPWVVIIDSKALKTAQRTHICKAKP